MARTEQDLSELGRHVAGLQDRAPEAQFDLARGRARLSEAVLYPEVQPRRRSMAVRLGASLAAAALILSALFVALRWPGRALEFDVGGAGAGIAGEWIAAPAASEVPIRFSDGSHLVLGPGSQARVAAVSASGAEITLERGALALSITHRDTTRWAVRLGPFRVLVVGTRFETRWDPVAERLVVALHEGEVRVSGPVVGEGRAVRAGEELTVSLKTSTLEVHATAASDSASPSSAGAPPVHAETPTTTGSSMEGPSPPEAPSSSATPSFPGASSSGAGGRASEGPPGPSRGKGSAGVSPSASPSVASEGWRALAQKARYKEALAAAEKEGFDGVCATAGAADLRALGDTARLGGSPTRSVQAFTALRRRFPGSSEASSAAFLLGRIAQDQQKDPAGAARWLALYLAEKPSGELAEEAAGRLVEAEDRSGNLAAARRAAERYLAAHPNGAHAAYARGVLAPATSPTP